MGRLSRTATYSDAAQGLFLHPWWNGEMGQYRHWCATRLPGGKAESARLTPSELGYLSTPILASRLRVYDGWSSLVGLVERTR